MRYIEILLKKIFDMDRSVVLLFVFSMLASIVNYSFQIMLGNMLSLSDFGIFNTINSLSTNLMCLYSPLAVYICRVSAENQTNMSVGKPIYQKILKFTLGISLILFCLGIVLFSNTFGKSLGVESFSFGLLFITMTIIAGIYTVLNGMLQGINKLAWYGFLGLVLMVVKFSLSYAGIRLGGQIAAAVWAMLISFVVVIGLIITIISITARRQNTDEKKRELLSVKYSEIFSLYGLTFLVQLFISPYINGGEIILMNYLYDSESVGLYSLAATVAKASMYVLSIFTSALLPNIASDWIKGKSIKRKFYSAMAFCFIAGAAWVLFLMTVGLYVIPRVFGEGYYQALLNVKYLAFWVIGIGMLLVVNTFYLAINRLKKYLTVLIVVTVLIVGCIVASGIDILYVPVVVGSGVIAVVIFALFDITGLKNAPSTGEV